MKNCIQLEQAEKKIQTKVNKKNHAHMENCKLQNASHPLHVWSLPKSKVYFQKGVFYEG